VENTQAISAIGSHFVRDKVLSGEIVTDFVGSSDQLADIFISRGPRA